METSPAAESHEGIVKPIEIYRFSREDEPEEPYIDYAYDGFLAFKDLIHSLQLKYPDKSFPTDEVMDRMRSNDYYNDRALTTYIAESGNTRLGGIIGRDEGKRLKGLWYVIDPENQNTQVAKKLLEAVAHDYSEVSLLASTFGYDKTLDDYENYEKKGRRQQALISYYKRLGFEVDTSETSYSRYGDETSPVPMIWRRK